jgi:alpha-ketoglutarate-dependent taurine dioxygenase
MQDSVKIKSLTPFGAMVTPQNPSQNIQDIDLHLLRELFYKHQLLILRGFEPLTDQQDFVKYCELWGEISLWPFGKVLELVEKEKPQDHIFDNNYVPMHWDGMYRPQVPEIQIFHCVHAPGENNGGQTTFSNTAMICEQASQHELDLWSRVTATYERKMEFYHSRTQAPIVTQHPTKGFPVIRYCEPPKQKDKSFVNHPNYEFKGLKHGERNEFMQSLYEALYSPQNFYAHTWQTGDIVLSDNYTLLHGRKAFTSGSPRHLRRVHVLGQPALNNPHLVFHS